MIIKNIETKIRLATFIAGASLTAALLMVVAVSFFAYKQVGNARKSVYILDANNVPISARQTDVEVNRPVEYRTHINLFHSLFFTLAPDDKFIEYQMKKAMYLIDESGALQYNNLREKGFFNSVLSSSSVLTIQTDSIHLDPANKYFRYYGKQTIDRRSSTVVRTLVTEGYLRDLEMRTENNGHGVLITRWKTLENKDISYVQKNNF
ncbi:MULTISPECIES: conjugative transposon protein TraK [Sphingobacterium]|uniref:Conjugative transposon protein TraK n=1 Tax=Sphingobacterium hotanense TaxID=649196 RepID=A0ABT7NT77_9SPHI|nr:MULTISPECIES: conjugative transposon protein TraK [Sphingobacterium]MDM1050345.1 conjugative transposon protein TraK [Sphingobacterium hotanense]